MTEKITEGQAVEQNKIQGLFAFSAKNWILFCGDPGGFIFRFSFCNLFVSLVVGFLAFLLIRPNN